MADFAPDAAHGLCLSLLQNLVGIN